MVAGTWACVVALILCAPSVTPLRPVWRRWAAIEVLSGRVSGTVQAAMPVKHIMPKQAWVDSAKDVQAELDAIASGLMSRREAVTSRGVDIEALDAEIAADKGHLASRLSRGTSIRFSDTLPAVWFEQLASERAVVRYVKGQPKRRFERIPGRRAEVLDCVVYAFAARQILTINWDARAETLRNQDSAPAAQARPRTIHSSWMDR